MIIVAYAFCSIDTSYAVAALMKIYCDLLVLDLPQ